MKPKAYKQKDLVKHKLGNPNNIKLSNIPWITEEQLFPWIQVQDRWFIVVPNAIPTSVTTWEYDFTISDIPFTPRAIRIQAFMDSSTKSVSDMTYDGNNSGGLFTVSWAWDFSDSRIIRLYSDASNQFWADPVKLIKWGIRIDITHASFWTGDIVQCIVTAYK